MSAKSKPARAKKTRRGPRGGDPAVDIYVGQRVRARRLELGMSQTELADLVGITFQQLQKNERGVNRLSASRLYETSRILDVPTTYFFEGIEGANTAAAQAKKSEQAMSPPVGDEAAKRETIELVRAYYDITDRKLRQQMVNTMRALARTDATSPIHDRPQRGRPRKKK